MFRALKIFAKSPRLGRSPQAVDIAGGPWPDSAGVVADASANHSLPLGSVSPGHHFDRGNQTARLEQDGELFER